MKILGLLALLAGAVAGCGYSLSGRGAFLPDYIKVIAVPDFVNQSPVGTVDTVVTKAVREEFQGRGRYRIVPEDTNADAVVSGTILGVRLELRSVTSTGQASRYAVTVIAKVEFIDHKTNKPLWSNPAVTSVEEYDVTTSLTSNDPGAFFGQNVNALDRLAKTFARSIVSSILENF